ncbi:hypothetical protein [Cesiribacter sp. SM1]|uniref:hypothetical protein n=1 Tax=Cesiribacter sp. SM1 TaxID=2861196 RepID=UPI001CD48019|nr:hypothetical protein [Cesiribacter sp. SM1]
MKLLTNQIGVFRQQWILYTVIAMLLLLVSFFVPSRVSSWPFPETIKLLIEGHNALWYLDIYALLLVPIIATLLFINNINVAKVLTCIYIGCQLNSISGDNLQELILFSYGYNSTGLITYIWFFIGGLAFFLLYRDIRKPFLKRWTRILLSFYAILFSALSLFVGLDANELTDIYAVIVIFFWTLVLSHASRRLSSIIYWPLFAILTFISFYVYIDKSYCVSYDYDSKLYNILKGCSSYILWLAIGFIFLVSIRKKEIISAEQQNKANAPSSFSH